MLSWQIGKLTEYLAKFCLGNRFDIENSPSNAELYRKPRFQDTFVTFLFHDSVDLKLTPYQFFKYANDVQSVRNIITINSIISIHLLEINQVLTFNYLIFKN